MRIALTANPQKPAALDLARRGIARLDGRADLVLAEETADAIRSDLPRAPLEAIDADVLVAIGGDGTFLAALQRTRLPLLPVNAGTFGFLAEVDAGAGPSFEEALDRLLEGRYLLEERMKLASAVGADNFPDATNEVVVHTSQVAKMRLFEIGVDGGVIGRLRADGIILATPTGSTSYALSTQGPILDPTIEAIVITAVAPFQTAPRAVVVDPLRSVSVRLVLPDKDGTVVIDGHHEAKVPGGTIVTAYRSPRHALFVRFGSHFFRQLKGKGVLPWAADAGEEDAPDDADLPPPA
ncbi:MAG: NAD(+)/NADH kinase [Thermoplasmata archaeon]